MEFKINKIRPSILVKSINIMDNNSKAVGKLDIKIFEKVNNSKIAKVIRWQQSRARLGTHMTKDVSELAYSTRKLRKQKGGGCARARNKGATQFRGGATVHGPDNRQYEYNINKKERILGLQHALSFKALHDNVMILQEVDLHSTVKSFKEFLQKHNIETDKILIVDTEKKDNILRAINNVYKANFLPLIGLNVESVTKSVKVIFTENAIVQLKERGIL